jgi:hypothetical protein
VIRKNDESILDVSKGLKSVIPASKKTFEVVNQVRVLTIIQIYI